MKDFIFVFDSGVGGISVLREMVALMPHEDFVYFGDSANAPYGTRSKDEVRTLTTEHVDRYLAQGAKAVCIACNTATSAAVRPLRIAHPGVPLVGIEPALKPAAEAYPGGFVLVMATPMTIREEKFHLLLDRYRDRANVRPLACPGLMEFVESGETDREKILSFLRELFADAGIDRRNPPDAVVLGCTHYPFLKKEIEEVLGNECEVFDGGAGTARELRRRLEDAGKLKEDDDAPGQVVFENSAPDPEKMELCQRLLHM